MDDGHRGRAARTEDTEDTGAAKKDPQTDEQAAQEDEEDEEGTLTDSHLLELFPADAPQEQQATFDSLNILSELASSVGQTQPEQDQQQEHASTTISDNAFQALLLASLSDPFPAKPLSSYSANTQHPLHHQQTNSPSPTSTYDLLQTLDLPSSTALAQLQSSPRFDHLNLRHSPAAPTTTDNGQQQQHQHHHHQDSNNPTHSQHQHAQDLLSALSAIQPDPNQLTLDHHLHHPSQDELDFDDPTLFSPFDPGQEQIPNQPVSLTDQIDLLFGSQPRSPQASSPTTKVYSNSFSFQQQQLPHYHQQQHQHQHQELNHLDHQLNIYNPLPLSDHHEFNFLFDPDFQPNHDFHPPERNLEEYHHYQPNTPAGAREDRATDALLAGLDQGIRNTQEEINLNNLDASIEHSLNLNQVYLDQIKNSLDHLNHLHQKAQKFLSISKNCVEQIRQQQQQQETSAPPVASSSKLLPPPTTAAATDDLSAKNLSLVSDQISPIPLPWFKHKFGVDLPSFEDAKKRDQYNSLLHQQPWQPPERRKLDDEVGAMLKLNNQNREEIDWNRVAQNFPDRKPIECKIQWTQKQDPLLNKSKWSLPEVDRLFEIIKKFEFKNWDLISKELATGRTPSECVKQFRIVTQEKREWTETDDLLLKEGVSTYGQNWQAVANHCGRSSNQCINRWSKTLRPDIKKGKWDPVEDEALKSAVAACGMVWKDVAPRVRGRTDAQCRERWCNILDPRIVVGNWTPEEDQKILRMRDVERKTWSEISKSFNGRRTDNHCMRRHSELKRVKDPTMRKQHSHPKTTGPLSLMRSGVTPSVDSSSGRQGSTGRGTSVGPVRPHTTLGRVLIAADSGYTRRNHHHHPLLGPAPSPAPTTPVQPDTPSVPDSSDDQPDPAPAPAPPAPPPILQNLPFNRAPNSRLRIVHKRVKYST